jgi:hypothetical protein
MVKDENGDLLADSRNILDRQKSYFSQLFNVLYMGLVMLEMQVNMVEPLVPESSPFEG